MDSTIGSPVTHDARVHYGATQIVLFFLLGFGGFGAIVGFFIGLSAYVPTAPVAALEVGIPAAALGGLLGTIVVAIRALHTRRTRHPRTSHLRE